MLYTGFNEIDNCFGGIDNGELAVIADDLSGDSFKNYILYNLAKQTDEQNRTDISDYDRKIRNVLNYKKVKFEKTPKKILVLGHPAIQFNVLSGFPRGQFEQNEFDLFKKQKLIFKNLPIQQSFYYLFQRSAKTLIKNIMNIYEDIQTEISALCVFGWIRKIPMLKEVAQLLNIPVIIFSNSSFNRESTIQRFNSYSNHIDKLAIVADNFWDYAYCDTANEETTTFYVNNFKTLQTNTVISNYHPSLFLKIPKSSLATRLKQTNCENILKKMMQESGYINKYNFSKYLNLLPEKNERFWAYIEVFQRMQIDDLYELLSEYKKDTDTQELTLAAIILRKLLVNGDNNAENILISAKSHE